MHPRRIRILLSLWIAAAVLTLQGCTSSPPEIQPPRFEDDFGDETTTEITESTVQGDEMLRQRAQFELRLGGAFPWDVARPDQDSDADPGFALGGKFNFEAAKNMYLGVAVDWSKHNVDAPAANVPIPPGGNQILNFNSYDKLDFLLGFDYDVPLWDEPDAMLFRFGLGMGLAWIQLDDTRNATRSFDDFFGFVLRPSVGLRFPVHPHVIPFVEATYDWIPERSLVTSESERVDGDRPIFSSGALWVGVAFEWD